MMCTLTCLGINAHAYELMKGPHITQAKNLVVRLHHLRIKHVLDAKDQRVHNRSFRVGNASGRVAPFASTSRQLRHACITMIQARKQRFPPYLRVANRSVSTIRLRVG